jgi:alkylated DNA repair dioxygenase AlkB
MVGSMIPGLIYIADFISEKDQKDLLESIDSQEWLADLKRRTQHYGYKYDYTKKAIDASMKIGSIPAWIWPYSMRLIDKKYFSKEPDQVIINEYLPGQGISRHTDCVPCFGDTVASLSLGSACVMEFEQWNGIEKLKLLLEPRSLLVLSGEARYKWMHSIPGRKEDKIDDQVLSRSRRVSLTFRTIKV